MTLPPGRRRQLFLTSIRSECFLKKSAPSMGLSTLATLKEWRAEKPGKVKSNDFLPKVSIKVPFAARRRCPGRGKTAEFLSDKKESGKTDMSAPLSIKNEHFDVESDTDMEPEESLLSETMPGVNDARRWSFPGPAWR